MIITLFLGQGPYTAERPFTALRFAYTALVDNNKVKMFFVEDGIWCVKKGQDPANTYKIEEWVQKCLDEGAEMVACGVCMKSRGMADSELIPGVKKGTMESALEMVKASDKQLFF